MTNYIKEYVGNLTNLVNIFFDISYVCHRMVLLEQSHDVGGQWLYESNVEGDDLFGKKPFLKVHSSIYESLRLTSSPEIMGFTDFSFLVKKGRDMRMFPSHTWEDVKEFITINTFYLINRFKWLDVEFKYSQ